MEMEWHKAEVLHTPLIVELYHADFGPYLATITTTNLWPLTWQLTIWNRTRIPDIREGYQSFKSLEDAKAGAEAYIEAVLEAPA
jgi:hypothetical protein